MTPVKGQTERQGDMDALAPEELVALLAEHQGDWEAPPVSWAASEALAARGKAAMGRC